MKDYDDVIIDDVSIEEVSSVEFEFDDYSLKRVDHHWEIQYEDSEGAQSIIVQLEDFDSNEEFKFLRDEQELVFEKSDFVKIEKFCKESGIL